MIQLLDHVDQEMFYMRDAVIMTGLCSKTLRRYIKSNKIKIKLDEIRHAYLFPLIEINKIRTKRSMNQLSIDDAKQIWRRNNGGE